jgi:hypothetical protein
MLLHPFTRRLILVLLKQDDILRLLKCDIRSKRPKTELSWDIFPQQIILKLGVQRNNIYATNFTQYEDIFLFSEISELNEMIGHNIANLFCLLRQFASVSFLPLCRYGHSDLKNKKITFPFVFSPQFTNYSLCKYMFLYIALQQKCVAET